MNNFKKMLLTMSAGLLILGGCTPKPQQNTSAALMKAGTYTAKASGYAGDLEVTVTVDEEKILSVEIGDNHETPSVGGMAIEQLPKQIVDAQSLAVDGISGATYTSNAIFNSVKDCLTQAGADLAQFEKAQTAKTGEEINLPADVVIIGAGAAGLSAALRLNELGQESILVLEKMAYTGGASATCGGGFLASGSKYQAEAGIEDSPELMVEELLKKGHNLNDIELTRLHAENSAAAIDWLIDDIGAQFNIPQPSEKGIARDFTAVGGGAGLMQTLHDAALNRGIEIQLNTQATALIYENGKVTGVEAKDDQGNHYTIPAKAVLLATGGYGNNQQLIQSADAGRVIYYGPVSSNGEGLEMAQKIGAKVTNLQYLGVKPNGLEISAGVGKYTQPANNAMWKASAGILVNDAGQRLINETSSEQDLVEIYKQQNDWAMYTVMDQAAYDVFYATAIDKHLFSEAEAASWISEKGTGTTIFVQGETLADAAQQAGIDADQLTETLNAYNQGYQTGNDEFGRTLTAEFKMDGPIYIVKQNLRFATSLGGLDINPDCQVLTEKDEAIEGLYAAGEVVGNVQGDASSAYLSWSATSGKIAAESIDALLK
ncbi:FAD-dependent oxidoreductase [Holdemania massiliensis]|uniref:FAD-dependent oxidoreductase n=1 Tax=Holdemania massiliensis TaxID=1468449 RepID=UPI001F06A915|nr:FAD-dependent oxidoreductase [Holdemania massiliensis]MCH1942254.1 FAD-dependent oxidoreductase [Holdemania massiliensis]